MTSHHRAARRDVLVAAGAPASSPGRSGAGVGAGVDDAPTGPIHVGHVEPHVDAPVPLGRGRKILSAVLVSLAVLVLAGTAAFVADRTGGVDVSLTVPSSAAPAVETPVVPGAAAGAPESAPPSSDEVQAVASLAPSAPQRVRVPAIGADSQLMSLGLNPDRTVEVPPLDRSEIAGWYRHSPTPGETGTSSILGHIDGGGKEGIFYRLQQMQAGQKVYVDRADGTSAEFTVTLVENVPKDAFPTDRVYGQAPDAQIRLISCGGALDRAASSYEDNVIVYATLTGSSRA